MDPVFQYEGENTEVVISGKNFFSKVKRQLDKNNKFKVYEDFVVRFVKDLPADGTSFEPAVKKGRGSESLVVVIPQTAMHGVYSVTVETPFHMSSNTLGRSFTIRLPLRVQEDTETEPADSENMSTTSDIETDSGSQHDIGSDTPIDINSDTNMNTDIETDTNTESESGADADTTTDVSTNTSIKIDTDTIIDTPVNTDNMTATDTIVNTNTDTEMITDTFVDTDTDTATVTDTKPDTSQDTGTDTVSSDIEETCSDSERNQDETGIDCGGTICQACTPCTAWGPPEVITGLGLLGDLYRPALSDDGLTMFFAEYSQGNEDIFVATRNDRGTAFSVASEVPNINMHNHSDGTPYLNANGLTLYFHSDRDTGLGYRDIMAATRPDTNTSFSAPTFLEGEVNSTANDHLPWLTADELTIIFVSERGGPGDANIWIAARASTAEPFVNAQQLEGVNSTGDEGGAVLTQDGLTIFYSSDRLGTIGAHDIWTAMRPDVDSVFSDVQNLSSVINSAYNDWDVTLSSDGRELFFASSRSGKNELWRSVRECF